MKIKAIQGMTLALVATSACADGTPTLTWNWYGEFDIAVRTIHNTDRTLDRTYFAQSNSRTTLLQGSLQADFGPNLSAIALEEIDQDMTASNKSDQGAGNNVFLGSPFQGQQYVGAITKFGILKIGVPNSFNLQTIDNASPFATNSIGGGHWSGENFGRYGATPVTGISQYVGKNPGQIVRFEHSAYYETPTLFGGLVGTLEYAPQNDHGSSASTVNSNGWLAEGLKYTTPVSAFFLWHGEARAGTRQAPGSTPPSTATTVPSVLSAGQDVKFSAITGNYMATSALKLYAGATHTSTSNDIERSSSANVGFKYTWAGNVDFMGNYLFRTANKGSNAVAAYKVPKASLIGLGIDYRFDKAGQTAFFWRFEDLSAIDAASHRQLTNSIGFRYGFNV